jgi:hypothetical protein
MQPPFQNGKTLEFTETTENGADLGNHWPSSQPTSADSTPDFREITDNTARSKT